MLGDCPGAQLEREIIFTKPIMISCFTRLALDTEEVRDFLVFTYSRVAIPTVSRDEVEFVFNRETETMVFDTVKGVRFHVFHAPNYDRED